MNHLAVVCVQMMLCCWYKMVWRMFVMTLHHHILSSRLILMLQVWDRCENISWLCWRAIFQGVLALVIQLSSYPAIPVFTRPLICVNWNLTKTLPYAALMMLMLMASLVNINNNINFTLDVIWNSGHQWCSSCYI